MTLPKDAGVAPACCLVSRCRLSRVAFLAKGCDARATRNKTQTARLRPNRCHAVDARHLSLVAYHTHRLLHELFHLFQFGSASVIRKAFEELPSVLLADQAWIKHDQNSAIARRPDQPSESLLECDDGLRHL